MTKPILLVPSEEFHEPSDLLRTELDRTDRIGLEVVIGQDGAAVVEDFDGRTASGVSTWETLLVNLLRLHDYLRFLPALLLCFFRFGARLVMYFVLPFLVR
jgi:hypothetical protein